MTIEDFRATVLAGRANGNFVMKGFALPARPNRRRHRPWPPGSGRTSTEMSGERQRGAALALDLGYTPVYAFLNFLLMALMAWIVFHVPMKGSFLALRRVR